jgi:hypothetical protein
MASRPKLIPSRCHSAASVIALAITILPISAIRPDFSATGMNSPGEIMPRVGWFQRDKRLDAGNGTVGERHLRLEVDLNSCSAMAWRISCSSCLRCSSSRRSSSEKKENDAAAQLLGRVEREVRMDEQVLGVVGIDRVDGDAGAGSRQDRRALEVDRLVDVARDALGHHVDVFGGAGALQDHDELVAAEPDAQVGGAAGVPHALGGQHQHEVAGRVAERVVDLLEAVEVELQDGQPLAAPVRALDQRVEMVGQEGAVVAARSARRGRR